MREKRNKLHVKINNETAFTPFFFLSFSLFSIPLSLLLFLPTKTGLQVYVTRVIYFIVKQWSSCRWFLRNFFFSKMTNTPQIFMKMNTKSLTFQKIHLHSNLLTVIVNFNKKKKLFSTYNYHYLPPTYKSIYWLFHFFH